MRQQGIWTKIVALFMLIALMAPVSVRAALCVTNPVGMRCCMKAPHVATKVAVRAEKSCCSGKAESLASGTTIAADDSCKCVIKTIPKDLQGDLKATTFVITQPLDDVDVAMPQVPLVEYLDVADDSICLFLSDSGPPRDSVTASVFGRAPPVN